MLHISPRKKRLTSCLILSLLLVGFLVLTVYAKQGGQNPDLAQGKMIFNKYCSGCHGTSGQGDRYRILGANPADFTSPSTRMKSDADLLKTIHEGKPMMPAWKLRLSQQESRDVLAYIRKLAEQK